MRHQFEAHMVSALWIAWGVLLWAGYPAMGEGVWMGVDTAFTAMALGMWVVAAVLLLHSGLCGRLVIARRLLGAISTCVAGCSYTWAQMAMASVLGWPAYALDARPICLVASACAAAYWSWEGMFLAAGRGGREDAEVASVSRAPAARWARALTALFFCIGCLRPLAMMWCLPHVSPDGSLGTQLSSNPLASLGLVASVIGAGVWILRVSNSGAVRSTSAARRFACTLLGSYASGEVACYAASRGILLSGAVGEAVSYVLCIALVAVLLACVLVAWRHAGQEPLTDDDGESSPGLDEGDERQRERLVEEFGLTEREASCLAFALDGVTSASAAERLGIKAPTVRAYQQRAYRKMGIASLSEARELISRRCALEPAPSPVTAPEMGELPESSSSPRRRIVQRASRACCSGAWGFTVAAVALPTALDRSWGAGEAVLRMGIMMMCALAAWAFSRMGILGDAVGGGAAAPFGSRARAMTWGVLIEIAIVSSVPGIRGIVAIAAFAFGAVSALISRACHEDAASAPSPCTVAPAPADVTLDATHAAYLSLIFFALGVAWEEVWRSASALSFASLMTPLFGFIIVGCIWELRSQGVHATRHVLAGTLAVVIAARAGQATVALFGVAVLLLCLLASSLWFPARRPIRVLPACAFFGVMGILAGGKVTNLYADLSYSQFRDVVLGGHASMGEFAPASGMGDARTAMLAAIVACLTLLMVLVAWALARLLIDVRNEREAAALLASCDLDRARLESYLAGRGLNAVQVEVALRIVAGESGPHIARKMCYSLGSVNSARDAAYRLLRVHRRAQLIALLRRDAGL